MDKEQKLLDEVLYYIGLPELPEVDETGKHIWIYAVAETLKIDGSKGYAVLQCIDGKNYKIKKDFGSDAAIRKVGSLRPYCYVQEHIMPAFKNRDDIVTYLAKIAWEGSDKTMPMGEFMDVQKKRIAAFDDEKISSLVYTILIQTQLLKMKEKRDYYAKQNVDEAPATAFDMDFNETTKAEIEKKQESLREYQKKQRKNEKQGTAGDTTTK